MTFDDSAKKQVSEQLSEPLSVCSTLGLLDRFKRQPGGVVICCPVHTDRNPSCSVTRGPDGTLRWKCFSCGATGDVFTLIASVYGLDAHQDFVKVLEIGADMAGIRIESREQSRTTPPLRVVPPPPPMPPPVAVEDFNELTAQLAHNGKLDDNFVVGSYLEGRGLLDAAIEDGWFAIGPDTLEPLVEVFGLDFMKRTGLVNDNGALKWPEHSLAIPWRTPNGMVQTIQRRHLGLCEAKRRYVFPTGLGPAYPYGIERLTGKGPIAIVEGAPDVLAWRVQAKPPRYETPIGVPGVSGMKTEWLSMMKDRFVTIAYDDDEAGNREAAALYAKLWSHGVGAVRRATPVVGKDWAERLST